MKKSKWINGAIPALLLHLSVGSVYAWSLFISPLSEYMGYSSTKIQFAFSLAIFFLGMSAAFGGKLVEENIHKSSIIGMIFFINGLILTGIAVSIKSLILLYIGYGVIGGIGLGVTYLTPCKTIMLWFEDNKGLAMGLSVMGFGFASTIASPIITNLLIRVSVPYIFYILSLIYLILMSIGCLLLKKPKIYETFDKENKSNFKYFKILKDPVFILAWIMFYLNIHCGLALIGVASPIMKSFGVSYSLISTAIAIMGISNGIGRLAYSTISDKMNNRINIFNIIFILAVLSIFTFYFIPNKVLIIILLIIISSLYGAGFSNIAPYLSDKYGMENISKIHGTILSAWAIAGLTGNTMTNIIYNFTNSYTCVVFILGILYIIALCCSFILYLDKTYIGFKRF